MVIIYIPKVQVSCLSSLGLELMLVQMNSIGEQNLVSIKKICKSKICQLVSSSCMIQFHRPLHLFKKITMKILKITYLERRSNQSKTGTKVTLLIT